MSDTGPREAASASAVSDVSEQRQAQLRKASALRVEAGLPPYMDVRIQTSAEFVWILREQSWFMSERSSTRNPATLARGDARPRPDFRFADFSGSNLAGVDFVGADLRGARFDGTILRNANLDGVDMSRPSTYWRDWLKSRVRTFFLLQLVGIILLSALALLPGALPWSVLNGTTAIPTIWIVMFGIGMVTYLALAFIGTLNYADLDTVREVLSRSLDLTGASLRHANCRYANFAGATLADTDLEGTDCFRADLSGIDCRHAHLLGTNFSSANLSLARFDSVSSLRDVLLDSQTKLTRAVWDDTPVTREESGSRLADQVEFYRDASRVYRSVALALRSLGHYNQAAAYRILERRMERSALLLELKVTSYLGSLVLDLVAGYGEQPGRIFIAYVSVITTFTAGYWWVTNSPRGQSSPLQWYEALVLSLSSFHGRGFFPSTLSLGDPVAVLAAIEAVIGLFIELTLIATFSRRFLGS